MNAESKPERIPVSILNEVLGPVMRGPSSSHCAAALRIGRMARDLMGGTIGRAVVSFDKNGSLPTTYTSQGSEMGLAGGLMGWDADDKRLPGAVESLRAANVSLEFEVGDFADPHPNTYRLDLANDECEHSIVAVSTGGGMIEIIAIDGVEIRMDSGYFETLLWTKSYSGDPPGGAQVYRQPDGAMLRFKGSEHVPAQELESFAPVEVRRIAPVLPVLSREGATVPFETCAQLLGHDGNNGTPLWQLALVYEQERGSLSEEAVMTRIRLLVRVLTESVLRGTNGTDYKDRLLGAQSPGFEKRLSDGTLLDAGVLNRMTLYVSALMEVKSSLGVIVAMPTAGSCAALPGAVLAMADHLDLGEEERVHALLAAGLIGVFIANQWSFAAEGGGCQAECGAASAMAAAALISLAGGTQKQGLTAASLALQNMLGLVCDPIAKRVEAPCLGRNVMAASNALTCANMALAAYDELIPLDEVIGAARSVGEQLPRELCCTALGGLSATKTSRKLEEELKRGGERPPE